ncbi:unnamed protein product [Fusarium venenatum]|uniref:Uncharacterized protein n=1 Tax=Fusarium venenatum TaxID=56646 RepID=A0A2L2TU34_9HYPO|nr:uncharacterized protein FVRRES_04128 [Fusarium venenatum]CEI67616.1 unnamed protein product [Fusarium venenatum]
MNEYNNLLDSVMTHQERPEPEESQIQSVRNRVDGKRPVYSEITFLVDWSDLKRARPTIEKGGLENMLARYSTWPCFHAIYEDTSARSSDPRWLRLDNCAIAAWGTREPGLHV